ncbi:MAG: undecaprenyl-diphosphate phosphatase [Desulfobulbaceae bacterium]|uniref:Undecaprenyl-diphosphatase n=1 Tax=Candidatus Desulfatifera sulfidica TaxID=2841691 RepID=A0A8J6TCS8_9BACT|nr:undecaprenyl-diphosphate phosphatase [Candidatus Desulfatifera sulfidica]
MDLELLKAIILGVVQGLTEFLPISSSGHLVIVSHLLHFQQQGIAFDVFVHLGTLLAVIVVFRRDILLMVRAPFAALTGSADEENSRYLLWDLYVVLATLPAVAVGLLLKDSIESIFTSTLTVYSMLVVTGCAMILARYLPERAETLNCPRALGMGFAQALAILPGLSRSGSTIFVGMALGVNREVVARFSFIMSIPAILGAVVLQVGDLISAPPSLDSSVQIGAGLVASALSGYFAIILLLDIIRRNRLHWFGYYCLIVSAIGFFVTFS